MVKQANNNKSKGSGSNGKAKISAKKMKKDASTPVSTNSGDLAGYIFMCNTQTKPECFSYRVFGLPLGKLDVVERIKKGAKLYLYDFNAKLLYGIYKATSRGGKSLEPKAFGGQFQAQVKFTPWRDCVPLPESVFSEAIKDNYVVKGRFDPELNNKQVKKLFDLFKPIELAEGASLPSDANTRLHDARQLAPIELASRELPYRPLQIATRELPYMPSKIIEAPSYHRLLSGRDTLGSVSELDLPYGRSYGQISRRPYESAYQLNEVPLPRRLQYPSDLEDRDTYLPSRRPLLDQETDLRYAAGGVDDMRSRYLLPPYEDSRLGAALLQKAPASSRLYGSGLRY